MVNHEKNKYKVRFLSKEIEDFVKYLGVEKNYASNTILSYERDLVKFSNFLDKKEAYKPSSSFIVNWSGRRFFPSGLYFILLFIHRQRKI